MRVAAPLRVLVVIVALLSGISLAPPSALAAPALTVSPPSALLGSSFTVSGTGFPANADFRILDFHPDGSRVGFPGLQRTDASGRLRFTLRYESGIRRVGTYTVEVWYGANLEQYVVTATFVVEPLGEQCFPETGQCVRGRFLDRWHARGGLTYHGYPLTGEFTEVLEDGKSYTVQYFERVRLEYHPENAPPHDILLGQFGRRIHPADPPVPALPISQATYYPETGHNVGGSFRAFLVGYFEGPAGFEYLGYPLTEEFEERLEDGKVYRVQYFERARMEYHPEVTQGSRVLLGQLGRRILNERYPSGAPSATLVGR